MRLFIFLLLLLNSGWLVAQMQCPKTEYGILYNKNKSIVDRDEIIKSNGPIMPAGKTHCRVDYNVASKKYDRVNLKSRVEKGVYHGIKYQLFYADGSGTIQGQSKNNLGIDDRYSTNWQTRCKVDAMDDTHWCALQRDKISLVITKDESYRLHIGYKHYPGSQVVIRIDKNKPISAPAGTGFSAEQITQIIEQLKTAKKVVTRYQQRPNTNYIDNTFEPFGFAPALEIVTKIYQSIK